MLTEMDSDNFFSNYLHYYLTEKNLVFADDVGF